ncbi:Streptothricin hydrolase [Leucoagaricus sp. SymC.cos]|nr:Streptothricin hydrolase [Leucoagaricus sp. SymC.cos]KXN93379.1 Streptothricin hydrolase [Leucoagaricus sp. SymC.cos]
MPALVPNPLPNAKEPESVLLLLDTQKYVLEDVKNGGIPAVEPIHKNIQQILRIARASQTPARIVHVRNSGNTGDPDEPDTNGWELIFPPLTNEFIIDKRKNNAFVGTNLGEVVPVNAELVVVGFQTDFSIRATCSTALARGNEVLLVRGAHKTYPRIDVLHGGRITPAETVELEIEEELAEAGVHLFDMEDVEHIFTESR